MIKPILVRKKQDFNNQNFFVFGLVSQFGNPLQSQENLKQRPTSFPLNTNQQIYSNQSYSMPDEPQHKIRFVFE